jgi:hypothetical protein
LNHVDLSQPHWASQPEAFWAPIVTFLRLPGVSTTIRPSEFLKSKTPSVPWQATRSSECASTAIPHVSLEEDAPEHDLDDFVTPSVSTDSVVESSSSPVLSERFSFSHVPPPRVLGSHRWPGVLDNQSCPSHPGVDAVPTLFDVWAPLQAHLDSHARMSLHRVSRVFSPGILCSPLWLTRPWSPHRRRRCGFGSISRHRSATTDAPTFLHVVHHLWPFLQPPARHQLQRLDPSILRHSCQRLHAAVASVALLRAARAPPAKPLSVDKARTRLFGNALLRFDFNCGDLVRWLAGECANRHRDWGDAFHRLQAPLRLGRPRDLPPPDFLERSEQLPKACHLLVTSSVTHRKSRHELLVTIILKSMRIGPTSKPNLQPRRPSPFTSFFRSSSSTLSSAHLSIPFNGQSAKARVESVSSVPTVPLLSAHPITSFPNHRLPMPTPVHPRAVASLSVAS